ncbi:MAG: hypothetical protein HUU17_12690 [Chthonomonadales bacterium]|nr:hypothetical protein [Chthonomonadales bacterium]
MAPSRGGKNAPGSEPNRMAIVVVVVVLAIAAAIFSITRTVRSTQGKNMGSLGGFQGKAEMMKSGGGAEETPQSNAGGKGGAIPDPNEGGGLKPNLMGGKGSR